MIVEAMPNAGLCRIKTRPHSGAQRREPHLHDQCEKRRTDVRALRSYERCAALRHGLRQQQDHPGKLCDACPWHYGHRDMQSWDAQQRGLPWRSRWWPGSRARWFDSRKHGVGDRGSARSESGQQFSQLSRQCSARGTKPSSEAPAPAGASPQVAPIPKGPHLVGNRQIIHTNRTKYPLRAANKTLF
jgi:hypothetical protein